ncbi:MAG: RsmD family RNA methyltransferase [Candidatus Peribacteraceae bacterium]
MTSYAAFIGHQPALSTVEIAALLPDFSLRKQYKDVVIFDTSLSLNQEFLDLLGGTIALARSVTEQSIELQDVPALLANELKGGKRSKVVFSLRSSGVSPRQLHGLYRACKQFLKRQGQPSRYVGTERKAASAVVLHEHDMLNGKRNAELALITDPETGDIWVGRTVGAQDVDAYSKRDIEKPVRDTTVGLLPPKLAQALLNLGVFAVRTRQQKAAKQTAKFTLPVLTVLDPFCGTGVIPMECLLRSWDVLASDASQKAVNGCTKNLDWLRKERKIAKKDATSDVWKQDALTPFALKKLPDIVVTETTLGPPLEKRPTLKDVQKLRTENDALQVAFLQNAAATLPGVPLVCTYPVWYSSKQPEFLRRVWDEAAKIGYSPALPVEPPETTERISLLYRRPGQFVGREIVVWMPAQ